MAFFSPSAGDAPVIEIVPGTAAVTWSPPRSTARAARRARRVPWFPSIGLLDYASAQPTRRTRQPRRGMPSASVAAPRYGDPLAVRPDLYAVFWRTGSLLCTAPLRDGRVDFTAASPVDWSTDAGEFVLIEHNLSQCGPLRTLDPPLHVARVDATGRLSFASVVADDNGAPVIGPTPRHRQPWPSGTAHNDVVGRGLAGAAEMWESAMRDGDADGYRQLLSGQAAVDELAAAGFTVTGQAAREPGLVSALGAAERQWTTGWYGGARLLTLVRYHYCGPAYGRDNQYDHHKPGARRVAVAACPRDPFSHDRSGMQGHADVEQQPRRRQVTVEIGGDGRGEVIRVAAGRVALYEPTLLDGPLPPMDHGRWEGACRRCGVPMSSAAVGPDWVPYVHELYADVPALDEDFLWCPAHPATDRPRPHAPVCRTIGPRPRTLPLLYPEDLVVPF